MKKKKKVSKGQGCGWSVKLVGLECYAMWKMKLLKKS